MTKTRWLSLFLLVSVAINLAVAGFMGSRMMGWGGPGRGGDRFVERVTRDMPPEAASRVRAALAAQRPAMNRNIEEMRRAREEVRAALTAEPFDRSKLEAAFANVRRIGDAMQDSMHAGVLSVAQDLGAPERARLARMLDRGPPGHPPRERGERGER
jgi:Spy/CpxP family protein refolding chaperone